MRKCIDLTGQRFGNLVVVKREQNKSGRLAMWQCRCDCGKTVIIRGDNLRRGHSKSCGCTGSGKIKTKSERHGMSRTKPYVIWKDIKNRCLHGQASSYGGRAIQMCERWKNSFANFLEDMGPAYKPGSRFKRIDRDGDFTPENCRWVKKKSEEHYGRKRSRPEPSDRYVETPIGKLTVAELAEILGIDPNALQLRINTGWSGAELMKLVWKSHYDPYLANQALNALPAAAFRNIQKVLKEMA